MSPSLESKNLVLLEDLCGPFQCDLIVVGEILYAPCMNSSGDRKSLCVCMGAAPQGKQMYYTLSVKRILTFVFSYFK